MDDLTNTADTAGSADQTNTQSQTDAAAGGQQQDQGAGGAPASGGKGGKAAKGAGDAGTGGEGAGTGAAPEFWEGFTDAGLKESPVVLRHKNVEDLARSLVAAEKFLGVPPGELIRKPTKDEDYAQVYKVLGAPEKPEDYGIGLPDKATDEDKALAERFAKAMFEKGPFPPQFVKAAVEFINGETVASDEALGEAQKTRQAEATAYLKKELGAAFDPELKAIGGLLAQHGPEGLADELDAEGLGDNPKLTVFLHNILNLVGEPQALDGQGGGTGGGQVMTPSQAKAARINLENDPVKGQALRDKSHGMHQSVLDERNRLLSLEGGQKPA